MEIQNQQTVDTVDKNFKDKRQQSVKCLEQIAIDTLSEENVTPRSSDLSMDSSQKILESQNSTEGEVTQGYLSLKNIKSKEEIQIESKQNQEILHNLNFNIDDLFKKISSLTEQITTELQPKQLKEKSLASIEQQRNIIEKPVEKDTCQKTKSTPLIQFRERFNFKTYEHAESYKPVFFQLPQILRQDPSINMKLFQTGKSLGCGKFGQVVQCRNTKTNALFALKKIFKSVIDEYGMQEQLLTELKILTQIDHPNIVKAYEAFTDDFHIFILMEYIHGNLLVQKLKCSEKEVKNIIRQVLEALKYLHQRKISHRDIKPENIILTADNVVKICDFGWAAQGTQEMNILCGTLDYVSPQMVKQESYTQKVDLWNIGVLTYELIHGYPPFKASSKSRIFEKVKNLEYYFSSEIQISQQCKSFISGFLKNQSQRQSIQWGLNHDFLKIQSQNNAEGSNQNPNDQFNQQLENQMNQLLL